MDEHDGHILPDQLDHICLPKKTFKMIAIIL